MSFQGIFYFISIVKFIGIMLFIIFSYYSFNIWRICRYVSLLFLMLVFCVFCPFFSHYLARSSQRTRFWSHWFSLFFFFYFIDFLSDRSRFECCLRNFLLGGSNCDWSLGFLEFGISFSKMKKVNGEEKGGWIELQKLVMSSLTLCSWILLTSLAGTLLPSTISHLTPALEPSCFPVGE